MLNKSLIEIFSGFSKEETDKFNDFIRSPYFNRREILIEFWDELRKFHPEYNISKEKLYKAVYPGKAYNYGTVKNLFHELAVLAERFIETEYYGSNEDNKNENLLYGLLLRNHVRLFQKRFKKINENLDKQAGEYNYHIKKYRLEALKQNSLLSQDAYHGKYKDSLGTFTHLTSAYFIDLFINHYNTAFMKNELNDPEYSLDFIHEALEFYDKAKLEKDFVTEIYYNAFMLELTADEKHYYKLKELLESNSGKLSNEQKYNFFIALTNFCIKMINKNNHGYKKEQYRLYKYMVENNIYSINLIDKMEGNFYRNTAGAASSNGEFEWAMDFIEKYKAKLDEKVAENYYNYAKTELYIRLKDWDKAADAMAKIKHTNLADKLNLKRWQMILFYEKKNLEELVYLIDSARHFIAKDKTLPGKTKENFSNFTEAMNILAKLNDVGIEENRHFLIKNLIKIIEGNKISHKDWFEEKLKDLK